MREVDRRIQDLQRQLRSLQDQQPHMGNSARLIRLARALSDADATGFQDVVFQDADGTDRQEESRKTPTRPPPGIIVFEQDGEWFRVVAGEGSDSCICDHIYPLLEGIIDHLAIGATAFPPDPTQTFDQRVTTGKTACGCNVTCSGCDMQKQVTLAVSGMTDQDHDYSDANDIKVTYHWSDLNGETFVFNNMTDRQAEVSHPLCQYLGYPQSPATVRITNRDTAAVVNAQLVGNVSGGSLVRFHDPGPVQTQSWWEFRLLFQGDVATGAGTVPHSLALNAKGIGADTGLRCGDLLQSHAVDVQAGTNQLPTSAVQPPAQPDGTIVIS